MRYENNDRLREYLDRGAAGPYREHLRHPRFEFNAEAFAAALDQVRAQFPELSPQDADARAAFRLLTSGVAPEVAVPLPSRWYRATTFARALAFRAWPWLKLAWALAVIALCVSAVILLSALVARAEPTPENIAAYRNALRGTSFLAAPAAQQPNGIILQFQQGGSVLATRPTGLVAFNCSTGMACSFSGSTFTLTSTGGGGGSGCVPSGATANALLYDTGSGTCNDVAKITWNNGTTTLLAASGLNFNFSSASTFKFPFGAGSTITNNGVTGQALLSNGDGTASFADPIVSGPDARAAAQTRNPVAGLAGIDYGVSCAGGPCVQEGKIDSSGNLYIGNFPSGFSVTNTPSVAQSGTWSVNQSGTWTMQPGNTANTTPWLFTINQGGNSASVSAANALKVDGSAVTQPVSGTVSANAGTGTFTVGQATGTNLHMVCDSGCGGASSFSDNSAFTAGSTAVNVTGGWYSTSPTNCTSGSACAPQLSTDRKLFVQSYQGTSPWVDNISQFGGSNVVTGTGAGGAGIPRVTISNDSSLAANQSVNMNQVGGSSVTLGSKTSANSIPVVVASDQASIPVAATLSAETTKVIGTVRNVGNGGASFDSTVGAGTAPANQIVTGAIYNSTEISPASGQAFAIQADSKGRQRNVIMDGAGNTRAANVNASNQLSVSCDNGCAGGTFNNNSDTVATSSTNGQSASWLYGFNGTTWDRLRVDGSKNLNVNCTVGCSGSAGIQVPNASNVLTSVGYSTGNLNLPVQAVSEGATGSAGSTWAMQVGGNGSGHLTVPTVCDNSSAVNMSTATTTQIIAISGTAGRTYICSINLVAGGADNVALISGSGSNCASNQAGLAGGTTAASGWNFSANGGITQGSGMGMIIKTTTTNNEICLVTSAAVQLSGVITWTQY